MSQKLVRNSRSIVGSVVGARVAVGDASCEPRRRRPVRRMDRDHLEQLAHLIGAGQALERRRASSSARSGLASRQRLRARCRCRAGSSHSPWATSGVTDAPASRAARATASKSTWAVRSCSPGLASTGAKPWRAHRLQRVARRARRMAVIDDQRDAAVRTQAWSAIAGDRFVARRRCLDDLAVAVERQAAGRDRSRAARSPPTCWRIGKRVEEFVGDEQQRPRGQGPRSPHANARRAPPLAEPRAAPGWSRPNARRRRNPPRASPAAHRRRAFRGPARARHRSRRRATRRASSNRPARRRPSRRTSG